MIMLILLIKKEVAIFLFASMLRMCPLVKKSFIKLMLC